MDVGAHRPFQLRGGGQRERNRVVSIPAPRGPIVDRNGTVLAADAGELEIVLSRMEATQDPEVIGAVAALVGETPAQVEQALDDSQYSPYQPVPVVLDPSMSTVQYLDAHPEEFRGVSVQLISDRSYPQNQTSDADVASQVLGYVSPISAAELRAHPDDGYTEASQYGQSGLENEYESYLRGTPGKKVLSVDAAGQVVGTTSQTDPVEGDTLVTNLDLGLQEATQSALQSDITNDRHTVDTSTGKYPSATDGAAVVMNTRTGAVLAMASYPTYNLSDWSGGISNGRLRRVSRACVADHARTAPSTTRLSRGIHPGVDLQAHHGDRGAHRASSVVTTVDDTGTYTIPMQPARGTCTSTMTRQPTPGRSTCPKRSPNPTTTTSTRSGTSSTQPGPVGLPFKKCVRTAWESTGIDLPGEVTRPVDGRPNASCWTRRIHAGYPNTAYYAGDNIETAFGQGETRGDTHEEPSAYATSPTVGPATNPRWRPAS